METATMGDAARTAIGRAALAVLPAAVLLLSTPEAARAQAAAWPPGTYRTFPDEALQDAQVDLSRCVSFADGAPKLSPWSNSAPQPAAFRSRLHSGHTASIRKCWWSKVSSTRDSTDEVSCSADLVDELRFTLVHELKIGEAWRPLLPGDAQAQSYALACDPKDDEQHKQIPDYYPTVTVSSSGPDEIKKRLQDSLGNGWFVFEGEGDYPKDMAPATIKYLTLTGAARDLADKKPSPFLVGHTQDVPTNFLYKPNQYRSLTYVAASGGNNSDANSTRYDLETVRQSANAPNTFPSVSLLIENQSLKNSNEALKSENQQLLNQYNTAKANNETLAEQNQAKQAEIEKLENEIKTRTEGAIAAGREKIEEEINKARRAAVRIQFPDALKSVDLSQVIGLTNLDQTKCGPAVRLDDHVSYEFSCGEAAGPWTLALSQHNDTLITTAARTLAVAAEEIALTVWYRFKTESETQKRIQSATLAQLITGVPVLQFANSELVAQTCRTQLALSAAGAASDVVAARAIILDAPCATAMLPYPASDIAAIGGRTNCLNPPKQGETQCVVRADQVPLVRLPGVVPGTEESYLASAAVVRERIDAVRAGNIAPVWPFSAVSNDQTRIEAVISYCVDESCAKTCGDPISLTVGGLQSAGMPTRKAAGCTGAPTHVRAEFKAPQMTETWAIDGSRAGERAFPWPSRRVRVGPEACRANGYKTVIVVGDSQDFQESGASGWIAEALGRWARAERAPFQVLFQDNYGVLAKGPSSADLNGKSADEVEKAMTQAVSARPFVGRDRTSLAALPNIDRAVLRDAGGNRAGCASVIFFTDGVREAFDPFAADIIGAWAAPELGNELWVAGLRDCADWAQKTPLAKDRCLRFSPTRRPADSGARTPELEDFLRRATR
jgi:hypothetical protein